MKSPLFGDVQSLTIQCTMESHLVAYSLRGGFN